MADSMKFEETSSKQKIMSNKNEMLNFQLFSQLDNFENCLEIFPKMF